MSTLNGIFKKAKKAGYVVEICKGGPAKGMRQIDFGHKKIQELHIGAILKLKPCSKDYANFRKVVEQVAPGRPCTHKHLSHLICPKGVVEPK